MRMTHQPKLLRNFGRVDACILIGSPVSVLYVHRAQEAQEGGLLRLRCHDVEAFFVNEQTEAEHLLRDFVFRGRYSCTVPLRCEHYKVLINIRDNVSSVILYFDNYTNSAGDPTPDFSLFHLLPLLHGLTTPGGSCSA